MTRHILVPLDGSPHAEAVLPHAAALARAAGSALLLLRGLTPVETSQSLFWRATIPAYLRAEFEDTRIAQARLYLAGVAERLQAGGLRAEFEVLPVDDEAEAIIMRADQDASIGLVAMATHGRNGVSRWVLGSVAAKVLQAVATPLLLVRVGVEDGAAVATSETAQVTYRTIVVPLDGSEFAERALDEARLIASATGATLVLLTVIPELADQVIAEAERTGAAAYQGSVTKRLLSGRIDARARIVTGVPAEQILEVSAEERGDLIVMATHGRGGWRERWLGSTANKVVQGADLPVLLVRPRP